MPYSVKGQSTAMQGRQGLIAALLLFSLLVSGFVSVASAAQNDERPIKGTPLPKVEWSAAELALREAMETDPTCTTKSNANLTQAGAIAGWKRFLERDDLTKEQRAFAWWRIGSLYAYNFDPTRGEKADGEQAERAFSKARELLENVVSSESLNSATVYATLIGKPMDRAHRLAKAFNWLAKRGEKDIERSAHRVNRSGSVLDQKFFPNIAHRESTLEERKQFLRKQLAEYQESIAERITQEIQYSEDPAAIAKLLESIEGTADKEQMEKWRTMHRELRKRFAIQAQPVRYWTYVWWGMGAVGGVTVSAWLLWRKRPAKQG